MVTNNDKNQQIKKEGFSGLDARSLVSSLYYKYTVWWWDL